MSNYSFKYAYINNQAIQYKLIFKDIKHMNMKIKDNEIIVTAPINTSNISLEKFVNKYIKRMNDYLLKVKNQELLNINKNTIIIFNKKYSLKIIKSLKNSYKIIGSVIYLNLKNIDDKSNLVKKIYKDLCSDLLINRTKYYANKFNLHCKLIKTKWMTSKWGYCNKSNKEIVLALQLGAYDQKTIDYVIIHELMHLIRADHSPKFWELVEKNCPNYKILRKKLNNFDEL